MKRAVFLDRDGVVTRALVRDGNAYAPVIPAEMEIDADAPAALARLKAAGFLLVVVTNQPDVARGITRREDVERMHATLRAALPLDACFVCYHDDAEACACRKPQPGMLLDAAAAHGIDLAQSYMIGDRWRDIDGGAAAGCRTIWIDRDYNERTPDHAPDASVDSLRAAADWILGCQLKNDETAAALTYPQSEPQNTANSRRDSASQGLPLSFWMTTRSGNT